MGRSRWTAPQQGQAATATEHGRVAGACSGCDFALGYAPMSAMKMRRSLAELEQEFRQHTALEAQRKLALERTAVVRSRQRWHERERRRSSLRFYLLTASLVLTAVVVAAAMFATLYLLLA